MPSLVEIGQVVLKKNVTEVQGTGRQGKLTQILPKPRDKGVSLLTLRLNIHTAITQRQFSQFIKLQFSSIII